MGIGMVITVAPLTTAVMGAVEERHAGVASGINNAVDRAAGLLAIAALGMVILSVFTGSLESHLAQLDISPQLQQSLEVQQIKLAGIQLPTTLNIELRGVLKHTIDEAFVSGFRLVSLICAGLALTGALCAGLMIESPSSKRKGQIGSIAKDEHIQYRHRTTSDTP